MVQIFNLADEIQLVERQGNEITLPRPVSVVQIAFGIPQIDTELGKGNRIVYTASPPAVATEIFLLLFVFSQRPY